MHETQPVLAIEIDESSFIHVTANVTADKTTIGFLGHITFLASAVRHKGGLIDGQGFEKPALELSVAYPTLFALAMSPLMHPDMRNRVAQQRAVLESLNKIVDVSYVQTPCACILEKSPPRLDPSDDSHSSRVRIEIFPSMRTMLSVRNKYGEWVYFSSIRCLSFHAHLNAPVPLLEIDFDNADRIHIERLQFLSSLRNVAVGFRGEAGERLCKAKLGTLGFTGQPAEEAARVSSELPKEVADTSIENVLVTCDDKEYLIQAATYQIDELLKLFELPARFKIRQMYGPSNSVVLRSTDWTPAQLANYGIKEVRIKGGEVFRVEHTVKVSCNGKDFDIIEGAYNRSDLLELFGMKASKSLYLRNITFAPTRKVRADRLPAVIPGLSDRLISSIVVKGGENFLVPSEKNYTWYHSQFMGYPVISDRPKLEVGIESFNAASEHLKNYNIGGFLAAGPLIYALTPVVFDKLFDLYYEAVGS